MPKSSIPCLRTSPEGRAIEIQLITDPWEQVDVDAFVCPINSNGTYDTFPASKLRELTGLPLDQLLLPHTPLAIGAAFVTEAGRMRARNLIHVPNTNKPGEQVQVEDIARATAAVIVTCELKGYQSVAMPLMGAFDTGIPAEEAARAIHSEFRSHRGDKPSRVLFVARNSDEHDVFEMAIEGLG
ncbi:macro domain-containing protein [Pseudenhygromyxa sp. WMMC2535]|uniref:macro domain-containing protein n=1 Tax=Pseudenhygromyxa sp. WMMC2535 TaxID=2712867 RepID=UPI0015524ADD|nr:macro domain-containing protein [Pseudenhygromyxa sp. WMMC2535]NVB42644.1 macro domain-containing protein [Pseudenhygromyxa sp. WMMC2535]